MKPAGGGAVAALVLVVVLLVSFAMPVGTWRTGDQGLAPLTFEPPPPGSDLARLWIDTDAACGHGARTDPDDCLAIALLARAAGDRIAGISTVAGNAPPEVVERTTRELAARLSATLRVYSGSDAQQAMTAALEHSPLTVVALGPLTNVAAVLDARPDLRSRGAARRGDG
jgi:inosine-uridine nucleoside N-ribohydrolase